MFVHGVRGFKRCPAQQFYRNAILASLGLTRALLIIDRNNDKTGACWTPDWPGKTRAADGTRWSSVRRGRGSSSVWPFVATWPNRLSNLLRRASLPPIRGAKAGQEQFRSMDTSDRFPAAPL